MSTTTKICPLLPPVSTEYGMKPQHCLQGHCAFWITVYTTEHQAHSGCAHALQPQMNAEGLLRV